MKKLCEVWKNMEKNTKETTNRDWMNSKNQKLEDTLRNAFDQSVSAAEISPSSQISANGQMQKQPYIGNV